MTHERDIERLLDHWFSDGPTETPDRVIDTVGDRIERLPQRPAWRYLGKERHMTSILKPAAALAAVLVLLVVGYSLWPVDRPGIGGPPASPSPTTARPSSSPAATIPPGNPAFACRGDAYLCEGLLDAGEHTSVNTDFGLSFTVPAGWSNTVGQGLTYTLNAPGTETDAASGQWIEVFQDPRPAVQDAACNGTGDNTVGHGVQDVIGWFRAQPALDTTTPVPVSIGGDQGTAIDVSLAPTWTGTCSGGGSLPMATLLASPPWTIAGPGKSRLIFLDIDSATFLVLIESSDKAGFDGLLTEAMPIVQSMHLTH